MNKKGFISTTTVYSFFLVFLLMLLFIVNNLVSNRTLLNGIKEKIKDEIAISSFASYIINEIYTTDGENGLYYHDADLTNGANDNNYRYSGSNPNNYVKFNNELWRIIGVINGKVKIIRNEAITTRTYTDNNKIQKRLLKSTIVFGFSGGMAFNVLPYMSIDLGYRYLLDTKADGYHEVLFGLRFKVPKL